MVRLIKTGADYEEALARIDELMGAQPDSAESDELELLVTLVELSKRNSIRSSPPTPLMRSNS